MFRTKLKFFQGVFVLAGTIIGVGMFGIPFVFAKVGFATALPEIIFLTFITVMIHLMYGELILRTASIQRLPGYAKIYLGGLAGFISKASYLVGLSGSLLAYIVVGGKFVNDVFGFGGSWGQIVFWAVGSLFVFFSIKESGFLDSVLNIFLVGFIVFFAAKIFPLANFNVFSLVPPEAGNVFFPYGVLLFSLSGAVAVHEVRALLDAKTTNLFKPIIITGTILPAFLYVLFAFGVAGVSGSATTEDALGGLGGLLPASLLLIGGIIGILACLTSFIILGLTLKETYFFDFKIGHFISWVLAAFLPLGLFLAGFQNFIGIIGFLGAVAVGTDSVLTVLSFRKARKSGSREPEYVLGVSSVLSGLIILMFTAGIIWEFFHFSGFL